MKDKLEAKKAMLKSLKSEMKSMMGEGRGDLSDMLGKKLMKVTVASDSKEGLEKGLSKAEEIMQKKSESPEMEDESEYGCESCEDKGCPECEEMEEESSEEMPEEEESMESLKAQLAELKKQLASKE
jgi:hypothetical protein